MAVFTQALSAADVLDVLEIFHFDATQSTNCFGAKAGTWQHSAAVSWLTGARLINDVTEALNDEVSLGIIWFPVTASYEVTIHYNKDTDYGECHVLIGGVDKGDFDCYAAAPTPNNEETVAVGSITKGYHELTLKASAKNAASTAYRLGIMGVSVVKV